MINEFIKKYTGVNNVGNTPENRGQCVGLVSVWMDVFNIPHLWGHAKDLFNNAPETHFQKIKNKQYVYPVAGDILVYDSTWGGGYGHTGIIVSCDPESDSYKIFEQNLPTGHAPQTAIRNNWKGVIGWLRIRGYSPPKENPCEELEKQLAYEEKEKDKYKDEARTSREIIERNTAEIKQKTETISKQQEQISLLNEQLTNNTKEISDIRLENKTLRENSTALQGANTDLLNENGNLRADLRDTGKELSDLQTKYKQKINKLPRWDLIKAVIFRE